MVLNKSEFFLMQHRSTHAASLAFACSCRYVAPGLNQSDGLPGHPSNFFSDREPQTGSLFAYWLVIHTAIWLAPSNFREGNFTNHDNTYAYIYASFVNFLFSWRWLRFNFTCTSKHFKFFSFLAVGLKMMNTIFHEYSWKRERCNELDHHQ